MEASTGALTGSRTLLASRTGTLPFEKTSRRKRRRIPLVFRFYKGAIHSQIAWPIVLHTLFAAIVVVFDRKVTHGIGLPASIIPSLSIVVGLLLVFRNQTSYSRFWDGRNHVAIVTTSIRNLTRSFLACSRDAASSEDKDVENADTEAIIKVMIAMLYTIKSHLRADWGAFADPSRRKHQPISPGVILPEYAEFLPSGFAQLEYHGVGSTLQLALLVEAYIKRGYRRDWWSAPQSSQLSGQLNTLVTSYGAMETIRLTPVPVSHLIHAKQVLAIFNCLLPFAMVTDLEWWTIPVVSAVVFTLYGIEEIAAQLEDPFGFDKVDINLDGIVEDIRNEILVLLGEWRAVRDEKPSETGKEWFSYEY